MKIEGNENYKPTPYHSERFKQDGGLLVEIIIEIRKGCSMILYYETTRNDLRLDNNNNLIFKDKIADISFMEGRNCKTINIYDAYSIETVGYDFNQKEYRAVEKAYIYCNGLVKPAKKYHRKMTNPEWMGYSYCWNT